MNCYDVIEIFGDNRSMAVELDYEHPAVVATRLANLVSDDVEHVARLFEIPISRLSSAYLHGLPVISASADHKVVTDMDALRILGLNISAERGPTTFRRWWSVFSISSPNPGECLFKAGVLLYLHGQYQEGAAPQGWLEFLVDIEDAVAVELADSDGVK